jgi:hypothetical protein
MVVIDEHKHRTGRGPIGYKVAPRNRAQLREVATSMRELLRAEGCYRTEAGPDYLDATYLLENVLQRARYAFHPDDSGHLQETVAFTIPDRRLIILRDDIYNSLQEGGPFARYTVVHEFSHIVLEHALTLHRGVTLGQHQWWEDSEWQANNLAAELLMPVEVVQSLDGKPLLIQSTCGVSAPAAMHRIDNLKKEGLL